MGIQLSGRDVLGMSKVLGSTSSNQKIDEYKIAFTKCGKLFKIKNQGLEAWLQ